MSKSREWLEAWTGYGKAAIAGDLLHRFTGNTAPGNVAEFADAMMVEWEKRAKDVDFDVDNPDACSRCGKRLKHVDGTSDVICFHKDKPGKQYCIECSQAIDAKVGAAWRE